MGLGDEVMATAQARVLAESIGVKTDFGEWSKVWKDNPYISVKRGGGFPVRNRTGDRPYVLGQTDKKVLFNPNFKAVPGEIYLTQSELDEADRILGDLKDFTLIQPEVKTMFSNGNKAWPVNHWKALMEKLDGPLAQMIPNRSETEKILKGNKKLVTETFRVAVAVLRKAKLLITCDGGLHHAAAATLYSPAGEVLSKGTPAVVIWTGFSHPDLLGYDAHMNVRFDDSPACGMKAKCDHCANMAKKLTPERVFLGVKKYLPVQRAVRDDCPTTVNF